MLRGLEAGFALDREWYRLEDGMDRSKRPTLVELAKILDRERVLYAVIGGVALQVHRREPRTTLDIDLAISVRGAVPRAALSAAGFVATGTFEHSENWRSPEGIPVQITSDPALEAAIARADVLELDGIPLRVLRRQDLLHEKLRASADPARRRSKRIQDLADAQALVEDDPQLADTLSQRERQRLARLEL
jgi:hypothetical protein